MPKWTRSWNNFVGRFVYRFRSAVLSWKRFWKPQNRNDCFEWIRRGKRLSNCIQYWPFWVKSSTMTDYSLIISTDQRQELQTARSGVKWCYRNMYAAVSEKYWAMRRVDCNLQSKKSMTYLATEVTAVNFWSHGRLENGKIVWQLQCSKGCLSYNCLDKHCWRVLIGSIY